MNMDLALSRKMTTIRRSKVMAKTSQAERVKNTCEKKTIKTNRVLNKTISKLCWVITTLDRVK